MPNRTARILATLTFLCAVVFAQQPPKPALSAHARLLAARTACIEHSGAILPYDVISEAFRGWGRYTIVADPAQADLILSIAAPVSDSGVSVSGGDSRSASTTTRALSSSNIIQIRLAILDARNRLVLWSANERPKSAMKERQREDNIVESSLRLFRRFRATIEPEPAP